MIEIVLHLWIKINITNISPKFQFEDLTNEEVDVVRTKIGLIYAIIIYNTDCIGQ